METPPLQTATWPSIGDDAFYGLSGRFVKMIEPHTEADPVGILLQFLLMIGNVIGRGPHFKVEADEHHMNLFTVLVGETAKGRKGVSSGQAKRLIESVDQEWWSKCLQHGLSSGEGLIWAVRDPIEKYEPIRNKGRATGEYQMTVADPGVSDKRLFILEAEFASTLRVLQRDGNTLSAIIRTAWDTGDLRTLTKNAPAQASGAHISIVGHITKAELLHYLDSTETANGFGNRFLWCCVKRSKLLPEGGSAQSLNFDSLICELRECVEFSKHVGEIRRDDEARHVWALIYPRLSEGKPGLLGSMIGRAEAQTMRLACLYALLDRSAIVRVEHLMAALSLWEYCEASARWIFGEALGDPVADEILRALKNCPEGLTRTEIRDLFGRHEGRERLNRALGLLLEQGLATVTKDRTEGRPSERWQACSAGKQASTDGQPLLSHMSLLSQSGIEGEDRVREVHEEDMRCDQSDQSDQSPDPGSQEVLSGGDESDQSDRSALGSSDVEVMP